MNAVEAAREAKEVVDAKYMITNDAKDVIRTIVRENYLSERLTDELMSMINYHLEKAKMAEFERLMKKD